jgi:hypothetical protein
VGRKQTSTNPEISRRLEVAEVHEEPNTRRDIRSEEGLVPHVMEKFQGAAWHDTGDGAKTHW